MVAAKVATAARVATAAATAAAGFFCSHFRSGCRTLSSRCCLRTACTMAILRRTAPPYTSPWGGTAKRPPVSRRTYRDVHGDPARRRPASNSKPEQQYGIAHTSLTVRSRHVHSCDALFACGQGYARSSRQRAHRAQWQRTRFRVVIDCGRGDGQLAAVGLVQPVVDGECAASHCNQAGAERGNHHRACDDERQSRSSEDGSEVSNARGFTNSNKRFTANHDDGCVMTYVWSATRLYATFEWCLSSAVAP